MKIKNRKVKNRKLVLVVSMVLLVALGYFVIAWLNHLPPFAGKKDSFQAGEYTVNLERTETEKKATEDLESSPGTKLDRGQSDTPKEPSADESTGKQQVDVMLTSAGVFNGQVSAGGMVTNVSEQDGVCTFVFRNGANEIIKTTETMPNSTSTSCKSALFPASELSGGTWRVRVQYDSNISTGVSNEKEFAKQ